VARQPLVLAERGTRESMGIAGRHAPLPQFDRTVLRFGSAAELAPSNATPDGTADSPRRRVARPPQLRSTVPEPRQKSRAWPAIPCQIEEESGRCLAEEGRLLARQGGRMKNVARTFEANWATSQVDEMRQRRLLLRTTRAKLHEEEL